MVSRKLNIYIYNLSQTPSMSAIHTFFSPFWLFLSPFSILTDLYYRLPSIQALEVREWWYSLNCAVLIAIHILLGSVENVNIHVTHPHLPPNGRWDGCWQITPVLRRRRLPCPLMCSLAAWPHSASEMRADRIYAPSKQEHWIPRWCGLPLSLWWKDGMVQVRDATWDANGEDLGCRAVVHLWPLRRARQKCLLL